MLQVGFAVTDITPAIGTNIPGGFAPRAATGVVDPLQARACVVRSGETQLAVVGVDAVSLRFDTVEKARTLIADTCGLAANHILVAASHTHSGGAANDVLGTDSDPDYCNLIAERIALAVTTAHANLEEAEVAAINAPCSGLAFNRRFTMRTGGQATNPGKGNPDMIEPAGPVDPDVTAIAFCAQDGHMLGMIGSFTCHCTVVGGSAFSGDYSAYWQEALREEFGEDFSLVFVNGACGDINQIDFRNPAVKEGGVEWARKMGKALAEVVIEELKSADFAAQAAVSGVHGAASVEYRHPSAAGLTAARELLDSDAGWDSKKWQARDVLLLAEMIGDAQGTECSVDVFRIGNAAICAAPWQPFCEFGLTIKGDSPFAPTMIAAFANGMLGYVPTPQGFEGGGYEPTLCRGSKLTPDAGDRIVAETVRLLRSLAEVKE